jgi:hypothetical protein
MSEITRTEKFLRACIDGEPCALKPLTRVEKLLAELNDKLAGGPSEVVILPETEFSSDGEAPQIPFTTPLSATPTAGAIAKVTYNGTEYPCTMAYTEQNGVGAYAIGNFDAINMPLTGGNPDAPFVIALDPNGTDGVYGIVFPLDGSTSGTLSIVQEGAASGGGSASAGGGVFYVDCTPGELIEGTDQATLVGMTKTYEETFAAYEAGQVVAFRVNMGEMMEGMIGIAFISGYMPGFGLVFGNEGFAYKSDGTAIMMNA